MRSRGVAGDVGVVARSEAAGLVAAGEEPLRRLPAVALAGSARAGVKTGCRGRSRPLNSLPVTVVSGSVPEPSRELEQLLVGHEPSVRIERSARSLHRPRSSIRIRRSPIRSRDSGPAAPWRRDSGDVEIGRMTSKRSSIVQY